MYEGENGEMAVDFPPSIALNGISERDSILRNKNISCFEKRTN
jgi:hypothetical protein